MDKNTDNAKSITYEIVHSLITTLLVPIIGYLIFQLNTAQKELSDFKVEIARELAGRVYKTDIVRLEDKIDELRNLFISEIRKHKD